MEQSILQASAEFANSPNLSAWVTAIAAIVLAGVTINYVWLTRKLLVMQTGPCVILSVVHDENRATIFQLVARNIGAGLARDIRFEFSCPLPAKASGITEAQAEKAGEMTGGPLIDCISALGSGECRKVDWGQYGGLMAAVGKKPIIATLDSSRIVKRCRQPIVLWT